MAEGCYDGSPRCRKSTNLEGKQPRLAKGEANFHHLPLDRRQIPAAFPGRLKTQFIDAVARRGVVARETGERLALVVQNFNPQSAGTGIGRIGMPLTMMMGWWRSLY